MQDRLGVGEHPQAERADNEASGQIAEHGAQAEFAEKTAADLLERGVRVEVD